MKFIRVLKAADYEKTELNTKNNSGTLVFKVELDFNSPKNAVLFRNSLPIDEDAGFKMEWSEERNLKLYKPYEELIKEQGDRNWYYNHGDKELPPDTTHLEFKVYNSFGDFMGSNNGKDYTGIVEIFRKRITNYFKNYTPNVKVTLIPPTMKTYDYKHLDYLHMEDRVDSLFETLSTSEIRNYDFVIVGKDKAEAKSIQDWYIQNSRYSVTKWEYRDKDEIRNNSYSNDRGDMTYIKTVSKELDNGIYCLTVRARKYFKDWQNNPRTLIPIYDAKASQLGGKVVIAKQVK